MADTDASKEAAVGPFLKLVPSAVLKAPDSNSDANLSHAPKQIHVVVRTVGTGRISRL